MAIDPPVSDQLRQFLDQNGNRGREMLLPALLETQKIHGYIPPNSARVIGETLNTPLADIYGVIGFYSMLASEPQAETMIRVCTTPS